MPVIPIDTPVIETFSALKVRLERDGKRLDDFDVLIAATAIVLNYTLVTNNVKHFARIADLNVTNWRPAMG
jgi:tRNA(fMet)-specific endonuclease VapC